MSASSSTEARSSGRRRRRRPGWLLPLLLLLLLAAIAVVLLRTLGDDDDERAATDGAATPAQTTPAAAGTRPDDGELTAAGKELLPPPDSDLDVIGEQASGTGVRVVKTTREGFFVGLPDGGGRERVYVELGGDVGEDEGEPAPEEGDRVNVRGPVRPAPRDPGRTLRLGAEDDELVREQGFFVDADEVEVIG